MLQPLSNSQDETSQSKLPPPRTCESCGKVVAVGHDAINVIIVIGSPGHPDIAPFQCSFEEHWACSLKCWLKVAHACIDEHMQVLLQRAHADIRRIEHV